MKSRFFVVVETVEFFIQNMPTEGKMGGGGEGELRGKNCRTTRKFIASMYNKDIFSILHHLYIILRRLWRVQSYR